MEIIPGTKALQIPLEHPTKQLVSDLALPIKKVAKKKALPIKKVSGLAVVASKHEWRHTFFKRKYVRSVKSSIENESSKWKRKAISSFPCS